MALAQTLRDSAHNTKTVGTQPRFAVDSLQSIIYPSVMQPANITANTTTACICTYSVGASGDSSLGLVQHAAIPF